MHAEFVHVHGCVGTHVVIVIKGLHCSLNGHQEPPLCPAWVKILFSGRSRGQEV